jgi:multicomponent Na+:H+ antiporter subunit E
MALVWWAVSEGRPKSWALGAPTVLLAAGLSAWLIPAPRRFVRPLPLLRFLGGFVVRSARGGLDVARRALSPSMPLSPGFLEVRLSLPEGAGRFLLADVLSLLPGTVTVDLEGDRLLLHVLEAGPEVEREVRDLEGRVADLLGLPGPEVRR